MATEPMRDINPTKIQSWPMSVTSPELLFDSELVMSFAVTVLQRMYDDLNHVMLYQETRLQSTERLLIGQSFGL